MQSRTILRVRATCAPSVVHVSRGVNGRYIVGISFLNPWRPHGARTHTRRPASVAVSPLDGCIYRRPAAGVVGRPPVPRRVRAAASVAADRSSVDSETGVLSVMQKVTPGRQHQWRADEQPRCRRGERKCAAKVRDRRTSASGQLTDHIYIQCWLWGVYVGLGNAAMCGRKKKQGKAQRVWRERFSPVGAMN